MLQELPYMTIVGLLIIAVGILLAVLPYVLRAVPSIQLEKIPSLIVWVYRRGDFVLATSPILILVSLVLLVWKLLAK